MTLPQVLMGGVARGTIRAVAFDLDGTLLDTLPDLAAAGNAMLRDIGRAEVDEVVVRRFIGDGLRVLVRRLITGQMEAEPDPAQYEAALAAYLGHYRNALHVHTRPYDGMFDGLIALKAGGARLACITNKAETFTHPLLQHFGLTSYFDQVIGGDTLPRRKPDPLQLIHCCEQFGIEPASLLMVGDSPNDVRAARAAGSPVVCLPYGYRGDLDVRALEADAIVPSVFALSQQLLSLPS